MLLTFFVKAFVALLNLLPRKLRLVVVEWTLCALMAILPKYKAISLKNIQLAFPDKDQKWKEALVRANIKSLARLIVDAFRMPYLDREWAEKNVEIPLWAPFQEAKREGRSILLATGHLGSFELQGYVCSLLGSPVSFVVRNFQHVHLDKWWNGIRSKHGNKVIDRRGAVKEIFKDLNSKRPVALLFDQNVTRKHAIFVDWFGKSAATSKTVGVAALRSRAVIFVSALLHVSGEKYRLEAVELNLDALYDDPQLSDDQKIEEITKRCVVEFEKLIRAYPESWFWMHRRWKTRPDPSEAEDFYG